MKGWVRLSIIALVAWLVSCLTIVIAGAADLIPWKETVTVNNADFEWGILPGSGYFWDIFNSDPGWLGMGKMNYGNESIWSFITVVFFYVFVVIAAIHLVFSIMNRSFLKSILAPVIAFAAGWTGYLFISMVYPTEAEVITRTAYFAYQIAIVFALLNLIFVMAASVVSVSSEIRMLVSDKGRKPAIDAERGEKIAEKAADEAVEKHVEEKHQADLHEEDARRIADEEIEKHVEEKHSGQPEEPKQEEPAPAEEEKEEEQPAAAEEPAVAESEPAEEQPAEEEGEEEEEEEGEPAKDANGVLIPGGKRRRTASFETKVKKSEEDLRHKYYDLRDYIKSYGIHNRISRSGDTFSLHRKRYVFITIVGKHMKVSFALDPKEYENSTIPVTTNTAKKYDGLPLCLKVKSNLSYRRALKLVDDLMAKEGYIKKGEAEEDAKAPEAPEGE